MVRHMSEKRRAWPALAMISVAGGAVLWHLLACMESPMAFSPDGRNLAFVTMEPYRQNGEPRADKVVFRLMVLADGQRLRVVEETHRQMLSAPAYSRDGKRLCYLRVPLPTEEQARSLQEYVNKQPSLDAGKVCDWRNRPAEEDVASCMRPAEIALDDRSLPSVENQAELVRSLARSPRLPVTLVVRNAASDAVISTTDMELPLGEDNEYMSMYLLAKPQYGADDHTVFVSAGATVVAADTWTGAQRVVAAPAYVARLSPDGRTVALLQPKVLGFVAADGSKATYHRWDHESSMFGLSWAEPQTVAVYEPRKNETKSWIHLVKTDGSVKKSVPIEWGKQGEGAELAEAVVSPDGRSMVVSLGKEVLFLSADGTVRTRLSDLKQYLARATFSPDSKRVAFKLLAEKEPCDRVVAIVFYTPDGKELSHVPVPPVAASMTQPAGEKK